MQTLVHVGVDLFHHRRQQSLLVTEVVMERATGQALTTEMLPVGLLTPIADALDTSTGTAELMISLPALLAALFAPLVVIASGGMDRRKILCGLLGLLAIANMASALAPKLGLDAGRPSPGRLLHGWHMGHSRWLGGSARSGPRIGLATSIIFGGVAAASVLGCHSGR